MVLLIRSVFETLTKLRIFVPVVRSIIGHFGHPLSDRPVFVANGMGVFADAKYVKWRMAARRGGGDYPPSAWRGCAGFRRGRSLWSPDE
jgi:hypothetical protein